MPLTPIETERDHRGLAIGTRAGAA